MINLEWLRTFRAVYRTKSLSRASELLNISQPTVSQHIQVLEAYIGKKLFIRRSKGVDGTDEGKILNTLVAGSIESLEEVEATIGKHYGEDQQIINIGISQHMFSSMFCGRITAFGPRVHLKFGTRNGLITDLEEGRLHYAIVHDGQDTMDIIKHRLFKQHLVLVSSPDIDLYDLSKLLRSNRSEAEKLLATQYWYAHDTVFGYVKLFWMHVFDKKRPAVIPHYVIPSEYETLVQLSQGSGVTVALDTVARSFIADGSLIQWKTKAIPIREMTLLANKKKAPKVLTERYIKLLKGK